MEREEQILKILEKKASKEGVSISQLIDTIYDTKQFNFVVRQAAKSTVQKHLQKLLHERRINQRNGYYYLNESHSTRK